MPHTRNKQNQATGKPTEQPCAGANTAVSVQGPVATPLSTPAPTVATSQDVCNQDTLVSDVPSDILSLIGNEITPIWSEEGKVITRTIMKATQLMISQKDQTISQMQNSIKILENRVMQLESQLDEVNQYKRRDILIVGGPVLPSENPNENSAEVIINSIKDNLHINITPSDISVAHRLGAKRA
ncbi:uncharacterized protein LOC135098822 [Scylla paramamosain]